MHTIDFLVVIPECFQIILINILLLFAICFSNYNTQTLTRDKLTQLAYRPFERYVNLPKLGNYNTENLKRAAQPYKGPSGTLGKNKVSLKTNFDQSIQEDETILVRRRQSCLHAS